jgi:hypothetical protein
VLVSRVQRNVREVELDLFVGAVAHKEVVKAFMAHFLSEDSLAFEIVMVFVLKKIFFLFL